LSSSSSSCLFLYALLQLYATYLCYLHTPSLNERFYSSRTPRRFHKILKIKLSWNYHSVADLHILGLWRLGQRPFKLAARNVFGVWTMCNPCTNLAISYFVEFCENFDCYWSVGLWVDCHGSFSFLFEGIRLLEGQSQITLFSLITYFPRLILQQLILKARKMLNRLINM
jgi:hypothetical protein